VWDAQTLEHHVTTIPDSGAREKCSVPVGALTPNGSTAWWWCGGDVLALAVPSGKKREGLLLTVPPDGGGLVSLAAGRRAVCGCTGAGTVVLWAADAEEPGLRSPVRTVAFSHGVSVTRLAFLANGMFVAQQAGAQALWAFSEDEEEPPYSLYRGEEQAPAVSLQSYGCLLWLCTPRSVVHLSGLTAV